MVNESENESDEHLYSTVDGDDDEDYFPVVVWSRSWLGDHNIDINAYVSEEGVPEEPILFEWYHAETKKTLSC